MSFWFQIHGSLFNVNMKCQCSTTTQWSGLRARWYVQGKNSKLAEEAESEDNILRTAVCCTRLKITVLQPLKLLRANE